MPIFEGSRYQYATIVPLADSKGVYHATIIPLANADITTDYTTYRVTSGDRLDSLAGVAYGDAELWWVIADANPEVFYPDDLVPGALLRIPTTPPPTG